jgi:hypothetical protein
MAHGSVRDPAKLRRFIDGEAKAARLRRLSP